MYTPLEIFINGIAGVFAGMVVLYISIKIISLIAGLRQQKTGEGEQ